MKPRHKTLQILIFFAVIALTPAVHAANLTWDITSGDGATITPGSGTWTNGGGNWNNAGVDTTWAAGNVAIFGGSDGAYAIDLGGSISAQALTFNNSGYTLGATSAQTISLTNTGSVVTVAAGKAATIGNNATVDFTAVNNAGTRISVGAGSSFGIVSGATVKRSGGIASAGTTNGTMGFAGSGIVNIAGTFTYTGSATTSGGGILLATTAGDNITVDVSGSMSSAAANVNGLLMTNNATATATLNLNSGGTVQVAKVSEGTTTSGTSNFNFNGGTLKAVVDNTSFMTGLNTVNVKSSGAIIDSNGFNVTIGQALLDGGGGGGLTKNSAGTLTLSGANTYTGTTTISGGTLAVSGGSAIANTGAVLVNTGAVFSVGASETIGSISGTGSIVLSAGTLTTGGTTLVSGGISGAGNLVKTGAGTLVLSGSDTFTGTIGALGGGTLSVSSLSSGSGTGTIGLTGGSGSGTLIYTGTGETTSRGINLAGGTAGSTNAYIDQSGTGLLKFTGNVTAAALNHTLNLVGSTAGTGEIEGVIADNSVTNKTSVTKDGSGTWTLSGANTYTGATTVNAGRLVINGNITTSVGTSVKSGATLSGDGTVGALAVESGAFLSPGNSPGILNTGNLDLQSGSTLNIELNGITAGIQYDQLNVTGNVTLAGLLNVSLGFTPAPSDLFFILLNDEVDAISGTFSGLANNSSFFVSGQEFQISYFGDRGTSSFTGGNDVVLMAVPEPEAALLGGLGLLALLRRRR